MPAKSASNNKRQMILLGVLVVALGYYLLHTFVLSGGSTRSKPKTETSGIPAAHQAAPESSTSTSGKRERQPSLSARDRMQLLLNDRSPLNLQLITYSGGDPTPGKRGNIFDYYKEPPKPPPVVPPPPITISYIQPQTAIAGTPRAFTMTVSGKAFPADAQILMNGRPKQTKRVNDSALTTEISPAEYVSQGSMNVEVKSQADPAALYSNVTTFVVQPAPDPPFKYVGRIGDLGVLEMNGTREPARVTRGSTVQGVWRVEAIRDDAIDVVQTQYDIKKRVVMQDKGRQ